MDLKKHHQIVSAINQTLTLILAGGAGSRLHPLTKDRAKPAVVFGGIYRIIDFALSNCINSGLRKIYMLTQYRSHSLQNHLNNAWNIHRHDEFIDVVPPQFRVTDKFYQGTADAIFQNIFLLEDNRPEFVLVLAGDHIYKMNYGRFIAQHIEKGADLTIGCVSQPKAKASEYGVVHADENNKIVGFLEKPSDPPVIPTRPDYSYVSMGIYVFSTKALVRAITNDAKKDTAHDFGKNVIPHMLEEGKKVYAYDFWDEEKQVEAYWRDIGDLDSYWEANMDLCNVHPIYDLYDKKWPVHTYVEPDPPCKTVFAEKDARMGHALDSLVSQGVIISGGEVVHSVLSPGVRVNSYSQVEKSILFHGVDIGRRCKIRNAIIDKGVQVPADTTIGFDPEEDRKHFTISPGGIVVIPKGHRFD